MKSTFIAWTRYNRRSAILAEQFGASMHHIYYGRPEDTNALIRYLVQSWRSWRVLLQERPDVVFVQNPPIFIIFVAYFYSLLFRARYVIDSHTGAFITDPWRSLLWLHKWFSKRAAATIIHNKDQESFAQEWQVPYCVMGFILGTYPAGNAYPLPEGFNVAFVCSFNGDEPVELVFEAAESLPEVNFFITGDYQRLSKERQALRPANCHFTGFMDYDDYVGLVRRVDAMLVLTTRNNTLLMGGFEAISLERPLIVSDSPILRNYFPLGTVYTPNTAVGITQAVREAEERQATLQIEIRQLKQQLDQEWVETSTQLAHLLGYPPPAPPET